MPLQTGLLSIPAKSLALLNWRARDLSLAAVTGQLATFSRTSSVTTTDSGGGTAPIGYGQPAWKAVSLDGATQNAMALACGRGEALGWPTEGNTSGGLDGRALTLYGIFIMRDVTQVNGRVLQFGSAAAAPSLTLFLAASGQLAFNHNNNTASVQTANIAVSNGDIVECRCCLNANGSVFVEYRIGTNPGSGSTTTTATTGVLSIVTPWSANKLWAGSGNGANSAPIDLVVVKMLSGVQPLQTMRDLF